MCIHSGGHAQGPFSYKHINPHPFTIDEFFDISSEVLHTYTEFCWVKISPSKLNLKIQLHFAMQFTITTRIKLCRDKSQWTKNAKMEQ